MEALPGDLGTIHSITLAARITRASGKDPNEQGWLTRAGGGVRF